MGNGNGLDKMLLKRWFGRGFHFFDLLYQALDLSTCAFIEQGYPRTCTSGIARGADLV
jgi:hypothetical protein